MKSLTVEFWVACFIIGLLIGLNQRTTVKASEKPRMILLQNQDIQMEDQHGALSYSSYHDNETGQEIVCMEGSTYAALSCYPTGRKW